MKLLKDYNPLEAVSGSRVVCGFSDRACGNMSLFYGDTSRALENRESFLSDLNINYKDLVCAKQVHGNRVKYINEADKGSGALGYASSIADTDGFVTDIKGLPLGIFTADCLSIFLHDPARPAVGLVHAGWRGSKEKIVLAALDLMRREFNSDPRELRAGFGPRIKDCCYEVTGEFREDFTTGLTEKNGRLYLDLAQVNREHLAGSGVKAENIFDSGFCAACGNEGFFSFRREGAKAGRMLSVIALK